MGSFFQLRAQLKSTWQHPRSKHWHQLDNVIANKSATLAINVVKANIEADRLQVLLLLEKEKETGEATCKAQDSNDA